jgi:hypothetical protein
MAKGVFVLLNSGAGALQGALMLPGGKDRGGSRAGRSMRWRLPPLPGANSSAVSMTGFPRPSRCGDRRRWRRHGIEHRGNPLRHRHRAGRAAAGHHEPVCPLARHADGTRCRARRACHRQARKVDLGEVNGRLFTHHVSMGLHSRLVAMREQSGYGSRAGKMFATLRALLAVVQAPAAARAQGHGGRDRPRHQDAGACGVQQCLRTGPPSLCRCARSRRARHLYPYLAPARRRRPGDAGGAAGHLAGRRSAEGR